MENTPPEQREFKMAKIMCFEGPVGSFFDSSSRAVQNGKPLRFELIKAVDTTFIWVKIFLYLFS